MENDIYKTKLKNLSSVTLLHIPRYTYVTNIDTLTQTIPRKWSYLGRLTWNPYMFIDDRTFCEVIFCKVWKKNQVYNFSCQLVHIRGLHAKRFLIFLYFYFLWVIRKHGQNGQQGYPLKEVKFSKTMDGSMK